MSVSNGFNAVRAGVVRIKDSPESALWGGVITSDKALICAICRGEWAMSLPNFFGKSSFLCEGCLEPVYP